MNKPQKEDFGWNPKAEWNETEYHKAVKKWENIERDKRIQKRKEELGKKIAKIREANGVSTYAMVKDGISSNLKTTIEDSKKGYTIDVLFRYLDAIGYEGGIEL